MKKVFIAMMCLLLSSCSAGGRIGNSGDVELDYLFVESGYTTSTEGMYYFAPQNKGGPELLNYVDFDTCNYAVVCPKPNCPHTDPDECYAMNYGNGSGVVIPIDGMIYWTKIENDGSTYLYRAKTDGTERAREAELPKSTSGAQLLYIDGKLYFMGEDSPFSEDGGIAEKTSNYLMCYDFEAKETAECLDVAELFPATDKIHAHLEGFFDGKIYMICQGTYFTYCPDTGKAEKTDLSAPVHIDGGYMIKSNTLISQNGGKMKFEAPDNGLYGYRIVGDKLFTRAYVYDITTGKRYENLIPDMFYGPKLYKDGKYLVYDWFDWTFEWVNESSVIGDEIP